MRRSPVLLLAVLLAALLALTGCSGAGSDADTSTESAAAAPQDGGGEGGATGGDGGAAPGTDPAAPAAPEQVVSGRVVAPGAALVRTAELTVQVDDVRAAAERDIQAWLGAADAAPGA